MPIVAWQDDVTSSPHGCLDARFDAHGVEKLCSERLPNVNAQGATLSDIGTRDPTTVTPQSIACISERRRGSWPVSR